MPLHVPRHFLDLPPVLQHRPPDMIHALLVSVILVIQVENHRFGGAAIGRRERLVVAAEDVCVWVGRRVLEFQIVFR
jgi:hypothetical protein